MEGERTENTPAEVKRFRPGPSPRRQAAKAGCAVLFLFGLLAVISIVAPLQFLWIAATGWATYAFKIVPQLTINWEMWACGLVALGLSLLIGHRFLSWLANRHPAFPSPWKFRTTFTLTALFLLLFGASIAMTGIVHQVAWLLRPGEPLLANGGFRQRGIMAANMNNVRYLKYALDGYTLDYDGKFPDALVEIVPHELEAASFAKLRLWRPDRHSPPEPWLYLGAGRKNTDDETLPILVQPRPDEAGYVIVLTLDGSCKAHRWAQLPENIKALLAP